MTRPVVECVPNVSEGRDLAVIEALASAVRAVDGLALLHTDTGYDANRTVFTFAGDPSAVMTGAFNLARRAAELIDMRLQRGTHPRIGALDVCPLVPVSGIDTGELLPLAAALGARIGKELRLPVFLYEESALVPERRSLGYLRRGEYENLEARMAAGFRPDFGPALFNPRSGATVLGVRGFLVAYNVSLGSRDVAAAKRIAAQIRERAPLHHEAEKRPYALKGVRAIGWEAPALGCVQVSTNITRFEEAGLYAVYETVRNLAAAEGLAVIGSELVGLAPSAALVQAGAEILGKGRTEPELIDAAVKYLGLSAHKPFDAGERLLEKKIIEKTQRAK